MKKNETKEHCKYYSWGDVAPFEYGAFCTAGTDPKCFWKDKKGKLHPQCWGCILYKRNKGE